jgi:hypothetical protein
MRCRSMLRKREEDKEVWSQRKGLKKWVEWVGEWMGGGWEVKIGQ